MLFELGSPKTVIIDQVLKVHSTEYFAWLLDEGDYARFDLSFVFKGTSYILLSLPGQTFDATQFNITTLV